MRVKIRKPDDWHVHLRDGEMLKAVLPYTAAYFARGLIMPNLAPAVTTIEACLAYKERILSALPEGMDFTPLMTCYLTQDSSPEMLTQGYRQGAWIAAKLYPAGATTNSSCGVKSVKNIYKILEKMEKVGMPLSVHGESPQTDVDVFDKENVFIDNTLVPLLKDFQGLKVVIEHVTTKETLDVVESFNKRVAATITPHHLIINRSSIFAGGLNSHLYCLPVAKKERDRLALRKAAVSGKSYYFLGTDTAPHPRKFKECTHAKAGIFNAPTALQIYAQVFEEENALDKLELFTSINGAEFYGLDPNETTVTLVKEEVISPVSVNLSDDDVQIFKGGEKLEWSIEGLNDPFDNRY